MGPISQPVSFKLRYYDSFSRCPRKQKHSCVVNLWTLFIGHIVCCWLQKIPWYQRHVHWSVVSFFSMDEPHVVGGAWFWAPSSIPSYTTHLSALPTYTFTFLFLDQGISLHDLFVKFFVSPIKVKVPLSISSLRRRSLIISFVCKVQIHNKG